MKLTCLLLALCSLGAHGVYISRMSTVRRAPNVFRPGVSLQALQRHGNHPRFVQAAGHRPPLMLYRGPNTQRYAQLKPYSQTTRSVYNLANLNNGPWRTTARVPATTEYELVRAAAAGFHRVQNNGVKTVKGAIHTIPAPNLSLSEKPIVVLDNSQSVLPSSGSASATTEMPKIPYEVTEKYTDPINYHLGMNMIKTEPIGFSKAPTSAQDLHMRNGAALQLASDLGLSAIALPPNSPYLQPHQALMHPFPEVHHPQQFMQQGLDGIIIQPNALYQPDPAFLQKIQNQLLQRFPQVEFVPYNAGEYQQPVPAQSQVYLVSNNNENQVNNVHHVNKAHQQHIPQQQHLSVIPLESDSHRNVVREAQEGTVVTILPQVMANVTEKVEVVSVTQPQSVPNVTYAVVEPETQAATTTIKYVLETSTEEQKTTPIFYAQIGQSVGNAEANGFYSAINDVRAAATLAQLEKAAEEAIKKEETTTATSTSTSTSTAINPDIKHYFVQSVDKNEHNQTVNELKSLLGVPFAKTDSVKVAYTLVRADDKETKVSKDGSVYAGQLVEATISEDQDFNKEKADLLSRRPPIRLFTTDQESQTSTTTTTPKITVVKAKIPPRSKLTFDDKTGEPVLRIYASYIDTPLQKDMIAAKLASVKRVNEVVARKQDSSTIGDWKSATIKGLSSMGTDISKTAQFGLKLRSRIDDIVPIFDDYED